MLMPRRPRTLHARIPAAPARIVLCAALLTSALGALATPLEVGAQGSPPAFDNASSASNSSTSSTLTFSHTVGTGSDRLLLVGVVIRSSSTSVTSITYNSLALTYLSSVLSNDVRTELWYRKNPPSGAHNVVVTIGASRMMAAGAMSFTGVHQTTTFGTAMTNANSNTAPTVNVSSATDELVVDVVGQRDPDAPNTLTAHASQAERFKKASTSGSNANVRLGGSTETGAATTTMSWTLSPGDDWGIIAVPLKPAPAAPTPTPYGLVTSQGITFPSTQLTGALQTVSGSTTAWRVESTYPAGTGWHITISAQDFVSGIRTIAVSNFDARQLDANIVVISGSGPPSSTMTSFAPLSTSPQTMLSASGANGVGTYDFTPDFRLKIPAATYSGSYSATVTATFIVGP